MSEPREPHLIVRSRFLVLLGMLVLLLLIAPIVVTTGLPVGVASVTMSAVLNGLLLSSVFAVCTRRRQAAIAVSLVSIVVVLQVVSTVTDSNAVEATRLVLGIATLAYVLALLLIHLFTGTGVTMDTIAASLCVYLLIGVLWSMIYLLIELAIPGSFRYVYAENEPLLTNFAGQSSIFSLYLSFTTLTTLGYGDLVPVSNPARMFAVVEAIVGQVYLAVLVARLVGMHIAESFRS